MHRKGRFGYSYIDLFRCYFLKDIFLRDYFQEGSQIFKPWNTQNGTGGHVCQNKQKMKVSQYGLIIYQYKRKCILSES